jgi:PLP dependent protein
MTLSAAEIQERYRAVRAEVERAAEAVGRASEAGCLDFGENRLQEFADKVPKLPRRLRWHFIGHVQTNKVKLLVDEVTLLHSVDRERLVSALEAKAQSPHDCLLEVNVGLEEAKTGLAPEGLPPLLARCAASPIVRPVGLMCIPPYTDDPEDARPYYRRLVTLFERAREQLAGVDELLAEGFVHLSMGMSHDFAVAIAEGATIVRVGTGIFGERPRRGAP